MEILDKKIEINTYTDLISYFKEVIAVLGKTRIKFFFIQAGVMILSMENYILSLKTIALLLLKISLQALVIMNYSRNIISGMVLIIQSIKMFLLKN